MKKVFLISFVLFAFLLVGCGSSENGEKVNLKEPAAKAESTVENKTPAVEDNGTDKADSDATDIKPELKGVSWTMELIVPSACVVRMDWNVEAVPEDIPVMMNTGTSQINMKSQDYTTFETGIYSLEVITQITQTSNGGSSGGGGGGSGGSGEAFENILILNPPKSLTYTLSFVT